MALPLLQDLSLPYAEIGYDGKVCVSKAEGSGGILNTCTCAEQLLFEIADPSAYITPDVDLKINHGSSNHDHFPQPTSYGGHSGRAKSHLVHAESRDGRISLLPDRSELVRPPEQLHEVTLVSMDPMHVSAHSHRRNKAQKLQEDTKDELGLIMKKPKRLFTEQSPFWPIKLKDRPPWASTTN